jgi:TRAP-type C4-dicarboxylate transport system permease small subunit
LKILKFLDEAEERLGGFMLIVLFLMVLFQIFARTVGWTIVWTEESSRFLFIWIILLGVSAGIKYGSHIGTDVFINLLPKRLHKAAAVVKVLLFLMFTLYMTKLAFSLLSMQIQFKQHAPATGIPGYLISAALPVCFIATSIRLTIKLIKTIKEPPSGVELSTSIQQTETY